MKRNHWSDQNTTALIGAIGGIAGSLINEKNSGAPLSPSADKVATLAQQTAAALAAAQQQKNTPPPTNYTPLLLGGGVLVIIVVLFLAFKK